MKTFDELKSEKLKNYTYHIDRMNNELAQGGLKDHEVESNNTVIRNFQSYADNIDEVVTIDIGAYVNGLIGDIQREYKAHISYYWDGFERFVDEYLSKNYYCNLLGIDATDLLGFKGRDPMSDETCDFFRQFVNSKCGTNIPMSGTLEQAKKEYEEALMNGDEIAKDEAYVRLAEVQRDSGKLKNGADYYLLATDQQYQEAKARCSRKSL